jgi:hypothetical protein
VLPDGSYLSRIYADTGARRNRRNGLLSHRAEKWTRFSAPNDASLEEESIGWIPKVDSTFGSDALTHTRGSCAAGRFAAPSPKPGK